MNEVFLMFPLEGQVWAVKASLGVQAGTPAQESLSQVPQQ